MCVCVVFSFRIEDSVFHSNNFLNICRVVCTLSIAALAKSSTCSCTIPRTKRKKPGTSTIDIRDALCSKAEDKKSLPVDASKRLCQWLVATPYIHFEKNDISEKFQL